MHEAHKPDALDARPGAARTYKALRQRARTRSVGDPSREQSTRWTAEERMDKKSSAEPETESLLDRESLCLPDFAKDSILHGGDDGFKDALRQYFPTAESNAAERLVVLKSKLRSASTNDFWGILMEDMCDIAGSQCGFVAKRILVDDQDSAVEMPLLGEPGSCLMGVALYLNNGSDVKELFQDYRYHAYGTPCSHMKHDKVFIVPEKMADFLPNNPNPMPWKRSEAYIGLPLFAEGKCFAHFGMIWDSVGASKRNLGWSFIEMFMHSLEDIILQRILEGRGFAKEVAPPESTSAKLIPLSAITASQSLQPYARSLSHELRTPMQGVVGMLDIMYSTVLDAIGNQQSERARSVFRDLKSHIEVVQESSKRAVEAADNVVHAYDLNMQMPETPLTPQDEKSFISPRMDPSPNDLAPPLPTPAAKKHERTEDLDVPSGPPLKRMFSMTETETLATCYPAESLVVDESVGTTTETAESTEAISELCFRSQQATPKQSSPVISSASISPSHRPVLTREFMMSLLADILRNSQPTSERHTATHLGETIEVKTIGSRGELQERTVHLSIESDVPQAIITEEQYLQFSLQKVIDNAIKFTESGSITISVRLANNSQVVEIWVVDTGCGIAEESKSSLFKPHFQQDASLSRSRDGLGLSLFNAKAYVRKHLGGDVTLERSATEGPAKGSEFLMRLPISTLETDIIDMPLLGAPIPSEPQPRRPSPWVDQQTHSNFSSAESITSFSGNPKASPRKRAAFNPNLGNEYPLNILVVEDNPTNRNVAIGSLNKLGYSKENICVAFDGLEAVKQYQESLSRPAAQRFDAILMDIWMPNMDGYEATAKIIEIAKTSGEKPTIVAVTADITEESVRKTKEVGMQGFLAKPYKVLDMEHLITDHFTKAP